MKAKQQSEKPQGKKVVELFGGSTGTSAALDRLTLPVVQERLRDVIKKIGSRRRILARQLRRAFPCSIWFYRPAVAPKLSCPS